MGKRNSRTSKQMQKLAGWIHTYSGNVQDGRMEKEVEEEEENEEK